MARQLRIVLDLDSRGFTANITSASGAVIRFNNATNQAQNSLRNMERRITGVTATMRDAIVIVGGLRSAFYTLQAATVGWAGAIVKANSDMQRMTVLLQGMSTAASEAGKIKEAGDNVQYLIDRAKNAPFSLDALTQSFVKLKAGGIDDTTKSMNALTDAVAAFGGNDDILGRASVAIQQMSGKGVISMEELRQQLGEAVPNAIQLMASSMNTTYADLVDRISQGSVQAQTALQKMFGEFERSFGGSAAALVNTFAGQVALAQTNLTQFATTIGGFQSDGTFAEGGFMSVLTDQVKAFNAALNSGEAQVFARRLGDGLSSLIKVMADAIGVAMRFGDQIVAIGKALLLYFGGKAIIGSIIAMQAAFVGAAAGTGVFRTALGHLKTGAGFAALAVSGIGQASGLLTTRLGLAAVAARSFGMVIGTLAGPIGIAITVLFAAGDALGFFKNRAEEANRALDDFRNKAYTMQGLKTLQDELAVQKKIMEGARAQAEYAAKVKANGGRTSGPAPNQNAVAEFEKAAARVAELEAQIGEGQIALWQGVVQRSIDGASGVVDRSLGGIKTEYEKVRKEIAQERETLKNDTTKSAAEVAKGEADLNARSIANAQKFYADRISKERQFGVQLERIKASLNNDAIKLSKPDQDLANLIFPSDTGLKAKELIVQGVMDASAKRVTDYAENARQGIETINLADPIVKGRDDDAASKKDPFDAYNNKLISLRARLADATAEAVGLNGELARVQSEIKDGKYDGDGKDGPIGLSPEKIKALEDAARDLQTTLDGLSDREVLTGLNNELDKATAEADVLGQALLTGMTDGDVSTARLKARVAAMVAEMKLGTYEAEQLANGIVSASLRADGLAKAMDLANRAKDIRLSMIEDPAERAKAEYADQVKQAYDLLNLTEMTNDERIKAEESVNNYISALRAKLGRDTESSFMRQLRGWQDVDKQMQDSATGFLDGFMDALMKGEAGFEDFAKSVLAKIADIIMQAVIANAIISAMGMMGMTGGKDFTQKRTAVPSAGADFELHGGGVVGESGGRGFYNPAIFKQALRYHNGGVAGLKPNEVPTVLEKGETVRTVQQERALWDKMDRGGAQIEFNLINQSGTDVQASEQGRRMDGERMIVDVVLKNLSQPGGLRTAVANAAKAK